MEPDEPMVIRLPQGTVLQQRIRLGEIEQLYRDSHDLDYKRVVAVILRHLQRPQAECVYDEAWRELVSHERKEPDYNIIVQAWDDVSRIVYPPE